ENNASLGVDLGGVDDVRLRKLGLDARYTAFQEPLPLPCRVVLGVFRKVAVRARLGNRRDGRRPVDSLQAVQLGSELFGASLGQRNFLHRQIAFSARYQREKSPPLPAGSAPACGSRV